MKNSQRAVWCLFALVLTLPTAVMAKDIEVKTNRIEAVTRSDGSVSVRTDKTNIQLPRRRRWYPWQYWRYSNRCRHSQASSHTSTSRGSTYQSTRISNCR